jgi:HNH endonuclease
MLLRRTFSVIFEQDGYRIRDQVTQWRLWGILILYERREEVWRKSTTVGDKLRQLVFETDDWQCVYCGTRERTLLTIDHRTPQSAGGRSVFDNLLTACKSCNTSKNGRTPEEAVMPLCYGRYNVLDEGVDQGTVVLQVEPITLVPQPKIVKPMASTLPDPAMEEIAEVLAAGGTLSDAQIKFLRKLAFRRESPHRLRAA